MPISVACDCGKSFRVKDELAGRKIRCPHCDTSLRVPGGEKSAGGAARSSQAVVAGDRPRPPRMPSRGDLEDEEDRRPSSRRRPPRDEDEDDENFPRRSRRSRDDDEDVEPPRPKKKKKKKRSRSGGGGGFSIAVHPQIITGLLMMIGASAWFIIGLANGIIFFYPPALFVLGFVAIIRGFMGAD